MTAARLPHARLVRAMMEAIQPHVRRLALDIQGAAQMARTSAPADANTLDATAGEVSDAHRALSDAVGCMDDAITGLETVALSEAHPDASDEEFEVMLAGLTR